ncbi:MAG TPA: condensation domain-containing protein [Caulobacterales bacterium]|nr:condensation domain-containing protein [Caulobacterales bacterium]
MRDGIPLTWAERTIWLAGVMSANPAAYNAACIISIEGEISSAKLAASIRQVLHNGGLLSAKVAIENGVLLWRSANPGGVPEQEVVEASSFFEGMSRLGDIFLNAPIKADAAPLISVHTVKISPTQHLVMFRHHHVLLDFHATATLVKNVAAAYGGATFAPCTTGRENIFSAEKAYLDSAACGEDRLYWSNRMQGLAADALWNPFRPAAAGGRVDLAVPAAHFAGFAEAARAMGSTPFQTLLLIVYAHIAREQEGDIVFGIPFANRTPETAEALASVSRILPFRLSFPPSARLEEAIASVRGAFKRDIQRARFPIWENAEQIFPGAPRGALPRVALNFMRTTALPFGSATATVSKVLYGERNAETYIRCIEERDGSLSLSLDAAGDRQGAQHLGAAMAAAIHAISANPQPARELRALA